MMTDASGKPISPLVKKTRKARLRRLEILRMRPSASSSASRALAGDATKSSASSVDSSEEASPSERCGQSGGRGLLYGHVSVMGRQRVMEDTVTVAPLGWLEGEYSFFAVYDGHGGAMVAEKCRDRMHKSLERVIDRTVPEGGGNRMIAWPTVMAECFCSMDKELLEEDAGEEAAAAVGKITGSTAVVVVVGKEDIVVANCGDSRAVLCRAGAALPLSHDHKSQPERADEKERIEAAGGRVLNWNGWRVQGILATSRSLGDHCLKPYVTSEPEVTVVKRSDTDEFLIIATDGLFDFVENDLACRLAKKYLKAADGASEAAAALAEVAMAKGSRDNISVIIVKLK